VAQWLHRAAAIFLYKEHLLLQGEPQGTFWTLPGGRIKPLESSHEALLREMREELDTDIQIERLLWISEEFFINGDIAQHQFGFYYLTTLSAHSSLYKLERTSSDKKTHKSDCNLVIMTIRCFFLCQQK
jgi:8-oxo-dGTP pyrophosphatase MutT (NUDIX family)